VERRTSALKVADVSGEADSSARLARVLNGCFTGVERGLQGWGMAVQPGGMWQSPSQLCYNVGVMNERIEINPNVCHGSPVIRGTRVLVSQILGALSGGDSVNDVLADYPSITSEDVSAVFAFAGSLARFEDIPYPTVLS